ncbi:MarR family transcriptional regulator [Mycolicibacter heraklionensis]|uniref:MarR family transcriptional regulator n=1 Tax=Mycolicibacter heraklionensis TaxID=512402 RepID=A0A9X7ZGG4_9MYCO|nr:MarR family transcriptional regulator [Mycolicibacter heraklionensis]KLO27726.1 MarR family transcriptional regulator [Mycolicibacter heraklionensis]QZA09996.1 MarR family transcriptional regulator [Mycolicibacter heraklionensis]
MWRGYLDSTRLLLRELEVQLVADGGITFADFEVLVLLSEARQRRLRMGELTEAAVTTRSGTTGAVSRLARAGWLRRVGCDEDKRGWFAELTDSGLAKLESVSGGHVATLRRNLFDLLSARDVDLFAHAYAQIRDNLSESADPRSC